MSLEQSVKHYIQDRIAAKQEVLINYVDSVTDRIALRLDRDAEIEVLNSTSGPIEYTVQRIPDGQEMYSVAKMIQKELRDEFNIDFVVTFKTTTKIVVHFPTGFFKD